MVNANELRAAIAKKGLTQQKLAKMMGISSRAFSSKITRGVFWSNEIEFMIRTLDIVDPIPVFFDSVVS